MAIDGLLTILTVLTTLAVLILSRLAADVVLMGAMIFLVITGVLTPQEGLHGFANPGVMTIAVLYLVAAGLKETGAVQWMAFRILGRPDSERKAILKVFLPASIMSAFMNNTAVVAMFIPSIQEWSGRIGVSASKVLIPLSYAAILGGTCTIIGTSTNLVVAGLVSEQFDESLGIFSIAPVGIAISVVGCGFLVLFANYLLPDRNGAKEQLDSAREYSVEMVVSEYAAICGKSIAAAGMRNLRYGFLVEIQRDGRILSAVSPDELLEAGDVLVFVGAPEAARELRAIQGLQAAHGEAHKLEVSNHDRCLVEAVVGPEYFGLGQTIKQGRFRSRFQAAVISVSRDGRRINGKIGDIALEIGDTLLLETSRGFVEQYRSRRDFLLVSAINDSTPPDYRKAPLALVILLGMVLSSVSGLLSILEAAFVAAAFMLMTRCMSVSAARRNIDLTVLTVIAASFALGAAMTKTGVAQQIAEIIVFQDDLSPYLLLALVYLLTLIFTELLTNNAAAVLMFPIAIMVAEQAGVAHMPFVIALMIAASASFITPLGYQTNLMVMGPGGYFAHDFVRLGTPLSVLVGITAITLIPVVWNF